MKRITLLSVFVLAACGGPATVADGGGDVVASDGTSLDAQPGDVTADAATDAGSPDLGDFDAGTSTCLSLPTSLACDGTTRTVMGRVY
ncbi:MAG: hypothetical protein WCJ30_23410, partial [Deltaproteobacteria bacterium]